MSELPGRQWSVYEYEANPIDEGAFGRPVVQVGIYILIVFAAQTWASVVSSGTDGYDNAYAYVSCSLLAWIAAAAFMSHRIQQTLVSQEWKLQHIAVMIECMADELSRSVGQPLWERVRRCQRIIASRDEGVPPTADEMKQIAETIKEFRAFEVEHGQGI